MTPNKYKLKHCNHSSRSSPTSFAFDNNNFHIEQIFDTPLKTKTKAPLILNAYSTYLSKPHSTLFALGLHLLSGVTFRTDQLRYRLPVKVVRLVLIVTVPAHIQLVAAWGHELGSSLVMCTAHALLCYRSWHVLHCHWTGG